MFSLTEIIFKDFKLQIAIILSSSYLSIERISEYFIKSLITIFLFSLDLSIENISE